MRVFYWALKSIFYIICWFVQKYIQPILLLSSSENALWIYTMQQYVNNDNNVGLYTVSCSIKNCKSEICKPINCKLYSCHFDKSNLSLDWQWSGGLLVEFSNSNANRGMSRSWFPCSHNKDMRFIFFIAINCSKE